MLDRAPLWMLAVVPSGFHLVALAHSCVCCESSFPQGRRTKVRPMRTVSWAERLQVFLHAPAASATVHTDTRFRGAWREQGSPVM